MIVINYLMATFLGFLIYRGETVLSSIPGSPWLAISMIIGILFILMFFLVAFSTKKAGVNPAFCAATHGARLSCSHPSYTAPCV